MNSSNPSQAKTPEHPYIGLPKTAFWQSGVAQASPFDLQGIYNKKWAIEPNWKIATAGSCFAQHISRYLKRGGFNVLDLEPPPSWLPEGRQGEFGYSLYSARYGNIYTAQQLLQLAKEVAGLFEPADIAWPKQDRFYDALRPSVEPDGLEHPDEVYTHRKYHIARVREMLTTMDLFIFTLGLTEAWTHRPTGTVYPTPPGVIAGDFDAKVHSLRNFNFNETLSALLEFYRIVADLRRDGPKPKLLLTVSPVPLTATASGRHVLEATTYSKAVLRAVAGQLRDDHDYIDYFPSYEIISNPSARGTFYEPNLRSVGSEGVATVMRCFFAEHTAVERSTRDATFSSPRANGGDEEGRHFVQCEEQLLSAFDA